MLSALDLSRLWTNEWVVVAFFAYAALMGLALRLPAGRRRRVLLVSAVCVVLTILLAQLRPSPALRIVREWVPVLFLLQSYWTCGLFFQRPMLDVERWLLSVDDRLARLAGGSRTLARTPRPVLEYLELTYLTVYPLVPASFGLFLWLGGRDQAERFWVTVLLSGFVAYGMLPWIQTRPPRALRSTADLDARRLTFRRLNLTVLDRASVQVNTFPSGHATTAVATALAVMTVDAGWGLALLVLALSITLATVVGRYHYTVDSLLGIALGILGWWVGFGLPDASGGL